MSKAFTREDDLPDQEPVKRLPSPLPPGAKNYITPEGATQLRAELDALLAATSAEPAPAQNERIDHLRRSLESAVIVDSPPDDPDTVRFGAYVSVRTLPDGRTTLYRIVGVDETDVARGWISWVSPIARALLSAHAGDHVRLELPSGSRDLEILDIRYEA